MTPTTRYRGLAAIVLILAASGCTVRNTVDLSDLPHQSVGHSLSDPSSLAAPVTLDVSSGGVSRRAEDDPVDSSVMYLGQRTTVVAIGGPLLFMEFAYFSAERSALHDAVRKHLAEALERRSIPVLDEGVQPSFRLGVHVDHVACHSGTWWVIVIPLLSERSTVVRLNVTLETPWGDVFERTFVEWVSGGSARGIQKAMSNVLASIADETTGLIDRIGRRQTP